MLSTYTRERSRTRDREPNLSVQTQFNRRQPPSGRPPAPPTLTLQTPGGSNGTNPLIAEHTLRSAFNRDRQPSNLRPPMNDAYPPPLSPRRPLSPAQPPPPPPAPEKDVPRQQVFRSDYSMSGAQAPPRNYNNTNGHQRDPSHESISWLDPIEESGGSSSSSVHSRSSSTGVRRKHIRAPSGDTEAEFDAALDDAIEAAYDEGFEPEQGYYRDGSDTITGSSYNRRDRPRDEERDALELANERERRLRLQQQLEDEEYRKRGWTGHDDFYDEGNDSEEEERFLEEMTNGYQIEDFAFGHGKKQAVPRESDSSGVTNRTWHSSTGSNQNTSTTMLTTVSESPSRPEPKGPLPPLPPPPVGALPQLPSRPPGTSGSEASTQSVRQRRLSGQNMKQLKIETQKLAQPGPTTAGPAFPPQQARSNNYIVQQRQALSAGPHRTANPLAARRVVSPSPGEGGAPPLPTNHLQDEIPRSGSPSIGRPGLRKNFSSSSLRSAKSHRNLSVSHIDDVSDMSPGTPVTNQFGISGSTARLPTIPSMPTPMASTFRERSDTAVGTAGMYLFDAEFHSADGPGSPNDMLADAPAPLEPCPSDVLLRPFWLMRCLYQTLCHPRGGYISNKLFVPRDVWRVKGVKLKYIEEKISQCDLMTAALQKLARVDTCDADAVLEEMQALETVIESVEKFLVKKLGASEVGPHATSFKDPVHAEDGSLPRSTSVSAKTSAFSWRRLRSKNSSANLVSLGSSKGSNSSSAAGGAGGMSGGVGGGSVASTPIEGTGKDIICPSLPMTTHPTNRPMKRDVGSVLFQGPNANYMSSLARLFDAAQLVGMLLSSPRISVCLKGFCCANEERKKKKQTKSLAKSKTLAFGTQTRRRWDSSSALDMPRSSLRFISAGSFCRT